MVVVTWRAPRATKGGKGGKDKGKDSGKGGYGGSHDTKRRKTGGDAVGGGAAGGGAAGGGAAVGGAAASRAYVHMVLEKRDVEMHEAVLLAECAPPEGRRTSLPWPPRAGSQAPYLRHTLRGAPQLLRPQWQPTIWCFRQPMVPRSPTLRLPAQAVRVLARALQVPPSCVSYAGTKDAKALTRQRVCVADTSAEAVAAVAAQLGAQRLRVGALSYGSAQLALGDLAGNSFGIVLRGLHLVRRALPPPLAAAAAEPRALDFGALEPRAALEAAVGALRSRGFINYFGMQRFGAGGSEVGRHVLRGDCTQTGSNPRTGRPAVAA